MIVAGIDQIHSKNVLLGLLTPWKICLDIKTTIFIDLVWCINKNISKFPVDTLDCRFTQYLAPEVHEGEAITEVSDWWSFGAILYEMVFGFTPFYDPNQEEMLRMKKDQTELRFPEKIPLSTDLTHLLIHLLKPNPRDRIGWKNGFEEIQQHKWFQSSLPWTSDLDWKSLVSQESRIIFEEPSEILIDSLQDREEEAYCRFHLLSLCSRTLG